jgi:drug/metabolite transporter (DMT)-like permease
MSDELGRKANVLPTTLVLISGVLWSFSGILIKEIHWNAWAIAAARSLVGGFFQFAFLYFIISKENKTHPSHHFMRLLKEIFLCSDKAHWLGAAFFVVNMIALVEAFQLTKAANAVFLHYAGLVLVAVFSGPILKQIPTKEDWWSVAAGVLGMLLIAVDALDARSLMGTLLGIVCGISLALCQICLGLRSQRKKTGREALGTIVLANALMFILGAPFMFGADAASLSRMDFTFLILLGVVPWAVPDVLYSIGIKQVPILRALILGLLDPVLTAVWPFVFLAERPGVSVIAGASIATAAVVFQNIFEQHKLRTAQQE